MSSKWGRRAWGTTRKNQNFDTINKNEADTFRNVQKLQEHVITLEEQARKYKTDFTEMEINMHMMHENSIRSVEILAQVATELAALNLKMQR